MRRKPRTSVHDDDEMGLSAELKLEQIETQTRPCLEYSELLPQIRAGRLLADQAARKNGARVAALATSPLGSTTHTTPDPRYARMLERFGLTAQEQLTCGFHVHTYIESPDEGVAVLDRIRDKLAVLIALSANSPFWNGVPTGFESYRTQAWNRWPTSGPSGIYGTYSAYRRVVTRLLDSGVMLDEGMIYFDARLSRNHPTVEVRVADVCLRAEDAALIAVLVRALVESASREWRDGVDPAPVPTVLLRMAAWQASSSGLRGELLDFGTFRPAPAVDVVRSLVDLPGAGARREQGELTWPGRASRTSLPAVPARLSSAGPGLGDGKISARRRRAGCRRRACRAGHAARDGVRGRRRRRGRCSGTRTAARPPVLIGIAQARTGTSAPSSSANWQLMPS